MSIEWCDPPPPPSGNSPGAMSRFVEELKKHPGRWAKYPSKNSGAATYLRKRYGCEATVRRTATGVDVFVRWPEDAS